MDKSHSVSSGSAQQDDSWTCQRCGWVYPNAHPSAKHRRNHKKQCGKVKGFALKSELHKGGSSDEASSGDDSHTGKGRAAPVVDNTNAPQSRDLLLNELNVPGNGRSHTPFLEDTSTSLDVKPKVSDNESTGDIINMDAVKMESSVPRSELEPSIDPLVKTSKTSEGQTMNAALADRVEEPACVLPGSNADEAKEFVKDIKHEDSPMDFTANRPLGSVNEHSYPPVPEVDTVEAAVHDSTRLDFDQAGSAGLKSEGMSPKYKESVASPEVPLNISEDKTKATPPLDKVEIAAHESQGLDFNHTKGNDAVSKEHWLDRKGSSQGDDSWMCRHCGWVYPNPHPSAKHRKKHKKQCGKIKGVKVHTEPHNGGSSDEVSSDEDVHVKQEHIPHPPLQVLLPQEQANDKLVTESLPSNVDQAAKFGEGESVTKSASNNPQCRDLSAQVEAPDRQPEDTQNVKEIPTPNMVPSVVPELPQNGPFLDQQSLPAGDNKDVSDEPDIPLTKESPTHLSLKEEDPPNQETFEISERQSNAVPSLPTIVDTLASESHNDLGKDANVEHGTRINFAEEPAGLSAENAPDGIPSMSDLKSPDTSPPVQCDDKGASIHEVDEPNVVISALDSRGAGLSNETMDVPVGNGLNGIVKEERENPELSGLNTASDLDALDDTMSNDPLRKDTGAIPTGGSTGQHKPESISKDLSSHTSPADEVPVKNKSLIENLLPLTGLSIPNVTGLVNNANEEGRNHSVKTAANPVQFVPRDELSGNGDAVWSTVDKTDETPPVTNMEHILDEQMAPSLIDNTDKESSMTDAILENQSASIGDVPKEVTFPAVTSGEAISIQRSFDEFPHKDVRPVAEDSGQGEVGGKTEYSNPKICIAKDSGVVDPAIQSEVEGMANGTASTKDGEQEKSKAIGALETMGGPETKEETSFKTGSPEATPEEMVKPDAKEETPSETEGVGPSDLSYGETYDFTRSESLVTAPSDFGALSHKLSDSLEIFEDAPDSLDTCSVGGSVEENESWDEPRQASGRLQQEPEHLGAVSLGERVPSESATVIADAKDLGDDTSDEPAPGESVAAEQTSSVSNGSRLEEESSEERATTTPPAGTSYGGRNKMEDLKAPSPEAWQEPGPSNLKSEGKKLSSTSEVTEDSSKSGESHMALRNLMAKEGQHKAEPVVETSTPTGKAKSSNSKEGFVASTNGMKPKSRSFWRYLTCCSSVH